MPWRCWIEAEEIVDLEAVTVLDARAGEAGRSAYLERRLRSARHADLESDLSAPAATPEIGGRHPLPEAAVWARTLGRWGLRTDSTVVVYDDSGGGLAAARAWWMLRASGIERVAILEGGLRAAERAGVPMESGEPPRSSEQGTTSFPFRRWRLPLASVAEVERRCRRREGVVLDVRSAERFRGELEPFDPVAGHVPGAVNLPWESSLEPSGRLRPVQELLADLERVLGDTPPEQVIVHCGSGVTACQTLWMMERVGRAGAALWVGSWSEWCRSGRPVATGSS